MVSTIAKKGRSLKSFRRRKRFLHKLKQSRGMVDAAQMKAVDCEIAESTGGNTMHFSCSQGRRRVVGYVKLYFVV